MRGVRSAVAALLLCGCASVQTPSQPEPSAPSREVLITEPRDARARATAHTELASAYFERGNLAVALDEARTAAQADPSYAPAQNVLGLIYMELKEPAQAQAGFEQALRVDPQD